MESRTPTPLEWASWIVVVGMIIGAMVSLREAIPPHDQGPLAQIQARPWELLLAMLVMEAAFGIAGAIAAPVYYAYLKQELSDRGLV